MTIVEFTLGVLWSLVCQLAMCVVAGAFVVTVCWFWWTYVSPLFKNTEENT